MICTSHVPNFVGCFPNFEKAYCRMESIENGQGHRHMGNDRPRPFAEEIQLLKISELKNAFQSLFVDALLTCVRRNIALLFTSALIDHSAILATRRNVTISRPGFFRFWRRKNN